MRSQGSELSREGACQEEEKVMRYQPSVKLCGTMNKQLASALRKVHTSYALVLATLIAVPVKEGTYTRYVLVLATIATICIVVLTKIKVMP